MKRKIFAFLLATAMVLALILGPIGERVCADIRGLLLQVRRISGIMQ